MADKRALSGVIAFLTLPVCVLGHPPCAFADSPKGQWGRVTPIADDNHPNLYYNQTEVNELREMILVRQSPQHLVDLYNNDIRNVAAQPQQYDEWDDTNMRAAINYMIEPSAAKAAALKAAVLSYRDAFPSGLGDWHATGGCHFCGFYVPWMFDLLQAYSPQSFTAAERAALKAWFKTSAEVLKINSRNQCMTIGGSGCDPATFQAPVVTREGKRMVSFQNWWGQYLGPALASALVSGDQAAVDFWADSGWPHDLLTFDGVALNGPFPSDLANRYDLVMFIMAVYPSGANTDTYDREGFNLGPPVTWYTTSYHPNSIDGGGYHWGQMWGPAMAAEMAYHNGMLRVFEITDVPGTEPGLLRTYKRSMASRNETDLRPDNPAGRPSIWNYGNNMLGWRRYSDPLIDNVPTLVEPHLYNVGWLDIPKTFMGYPRHVVWPRQGRTPGMPTGLSVH